MSASLSGIPLPPRIPSPKARALLFRIPVGRGLRVVVGTIFLVVGVPLTAGLSRDVSGDIAMLAGHRPARGRVLAAGNDDSIDFNGVPPRFVRFEYAIGDTRAEAQSYTLDQAFALPHPGDEVPLEVASCCASWARVVQMTRSPLGYLGLPFLAGPLLGAFLLVPPLRARRRTIRAFVHGTAVPGEVVAAGRTEIQKNKGNTWAFKTAWRFRATDGREYEGSLITHADPSADGVPNAGPIVVLYEPADPRTNTVFVA